MMNWMKSSHAHKFYEVGIRTFFRRSFWVSSSLNAGVALMLDMSVGCVRAISRSSLDSEECWWDDVISGGWKWKNNRKKTQGWRVLVCFKGAILFFKKKTKNKKKKNIRLYCAVICDSLSSRSLACSSASSLSIVAISVVSVKTDTSVSALLHFSCVAVSCRLRSSWEKKVWRGGERARW